MAVADRCRLLADLCPIAVGLTSTLDGLPMFSEPAAQYAGKRSLPNTLTFGILADASWQSPTPPHKI